MESSDLAKVTVIIPVYKTEKYFRASVESVVKQDYPKISIILVDDGSPDGSPMLCDQLGEQYPNIKVLHQKNGGLSSARNSGLDAVSPDTRFIIFLDSDDCLVPGAVQGMVEKALQSNADMVIPDRYTKVFEELQRRVDAKHFIYDKEFSNPQEFVINIIIGKGRAWRATALLYSYSVILNNKVRFPIGQVAEDIIFNLEFLTKAEKITIYPHSTLLCLKHAGSISSSYQPNFEKTIWSIDHRVRQFLKDTNMDNSANNCKADDLLARNLVAYLFSIFSKSNSMSYDEKKRLANAIINSPDSKSVLRRSHNLPYFESPKTTIVFATAYKLFQFKMDRLAFWLMSLRA